MDGARARSPCRRLSRRPAGARRRSGPACAGARRSGPARGRRSGGGRRGVGLAGAGPSSSALGDQAEDRRPGCRTGRWPRRRGGPAHRAAGRPGTSRCGSEVRHLVPRARCARSAGAPATAGGRASSADERPRRCLSRQPPAARGRRSAHRRRGAAPRAARPERGDQQDGALRLGASRDGSLLGLRVAALLRSAHRVPWHTISAGYAKSAGRCLDVQRCEEFEPAAARLLPCLDRASAAGGPGALLHRDPR